MGTRGVMSDSLTANIKKASFGFAEDYLTDVPVPLPASVEVQDFGWFQAAVADVVRVDMLAFILGSTYYALPLADIDTVVDARVITRYPTPHPYMLGGIQHSNQIYPVVDLRQLLEESSHVQAMRPGQRVRAKIAIVAQGGRTVGFRLEHVRRAYRIPMESLRPLPDTIRSASRQMIEAIFDADDNVFHVVSVSSIFRALGDSV